MRERDDREQMVMMPSRQDEEDGKKLMFDADESCLLEPGEKRDSIY